MSAIAICMIVVGFTFLFAWGLVAGGSDRRKDDQ